MLASRPGVVRSPWERTLQSTIKVAAQVRRVVQANDIDIVHAHASWAGVATRVGPVGAPVVFQPHGWGSLSVGSKSAARMVSLTEHALSNRTAAVLLLSQAEEAQRLSSPIVRQVKPVVSLEGFSPLDDTERSARRSALGWDDDAMVLVCVGEFSDRKQQLALVQQFSYLARRTDRLVLIGDGPTRGDIEMVKAENVQLIGWQSDVGGWLPAADGLIIASKGEGFSLVILEALASGVPVFSTPIGGSEVICEADGVVDPSVKDLIRAAALGHALLGTSQARTNRSERVKAAFEPAIGAKQIADVYQEVGLAHNGPPSSNPRRD